MQSQPEITIESELKEALDKLVLICSKFDYQFELIISNSLPDYDAEFYVLLTSSIKYALYISRGEGYLQSVAHFRCDSPIECVKQALEYLS